MPRLQRLRADVHELGIGRRPDGQLGPKLWPRCQVWAAAEGFADWVIFGEVVVATDGSPVVRELRVYPRPPNDQDLRAIPIVHFQEIRESVAAGLADRLTDPDVARRLADRLGEPDLASLLTDPDLARSVTDAHVASFTDADTDHFPPGLLEYFRIIDHEPATASVPARLLRAFSVDDLIELARPEIDRMRGFWRQQAENERARGATGRAVDLPLEVAERVAALGGPKRRTGRRGYPDEYYVDWAVEYVKLVQDGDRNERRKPVHTLARRRGEKDQFVHDTLHRARKLGLLNRRALTAKALALIEREREAQAREQSNAEGTSTSTAKSAPENA